MSNPILSNPSIHPPYSFWAFNQIQLSTPCRLQKGNVYILRTKNAFLCPCYLLNKVTNFGHKGIFSLKMIKTKIQQRATTVHFMTVLSRICWEKFWQFGVTSPTSDTKGTRMLCNAILTYCNCWKYIFVKSTQRRSWKSATSVTVYLICNWWKYILKGTLNIGEKLKTNAQKWNLKWKAMH